MTMFSQYIYSSVIHTVNNRHLYTPNYEIHKYRTRYNKDLHLQIANMTKYTEGPYFAAIKFYNHLPEYEGWNFNSGNYLFTTDTK